MSNFNNTTLNNYSASESKKVELQVEPQIENNPDVATNIVSQLVESDTERDSGRAEFNLRKYFKQWAKQCSHFYTELEGEHCERVTLDYMAVDYEFIPAGKDHPPQPVLLTMAMPIDENHPVANYDTEVIEEDLPEKVKFPYQLPYCLGVYIISEGKQYPKICPNSDRKVLTFAFDTREINAGIESLVFFQAMLVNIEQVTGLCINQYSINHEKKFTNKGLEKNTKVYMTYTEADTSIWIPDRQTRIDYTKPIRNNTKACDEVLRDNRPKISTRQGTTFIQDLWITNFNPLFENSCALFQICTIDVMDTRLYGGNSVPQLGKSLGKGKHDGFDFDKYNANYYLENYPEKFILYAVNDANLTLGIEHIKQSYIDVINEAVDEGLIEEQYTPPTNNHGGMTWQALAELRTTVPSIAEVLVFARMRKLGLFDENSKIGKDNAEGDFIDNKNEIKKELGLSYQKVKGGINQRTTETIMPEFFPNVKQYDASSMYVTMWFSGLRIPLGMPESLGSCLTTIQDFVSRMREFPWYTVKCSIEFPENSPKIKRLILQHYGDKCFCSRKLERQVLTPPELELIAVSFPDLQIKIHDGWYWDDEKPYLELKELSDFLFRKRNEYKKSGDKLRETATKLMGNGGEYGKFAQSKEQIDQEAYDEALINDQLLDAIGVKEDGSGLLSHPIVANAVTGCARALNALVAMKHNAYVCVTDSVLIDGKVNFSLDNCLTGYRFLDMLVKGSKYKDETEDSEYMAIVTGVRGRSLIPKNVTLPDGGNSNELESLLSNLDSKEKRDRAVAIVDGIADRMEEGKIVIPKIAKDGIKYEGNDTDQWYFCTVDCIQRLYGELLEKDIKRLVKRKEVESGASRYPYVCTAVTETRMLDCVDVGSYPFESAEEYKQIMNMKHKCKDTAMDKKRRLEGIDEDKLKPYRSFGEAYRFYPEEFEKRLRRAKPRGNPSQKFPSDWKRVFVFCADLGIISLAQIEKITGVGKRTISNWKQTLIGSGNYQRWFKKVFNELVNHKSIKYISQNCKLDATGAFEQSSLAGLIDETLTKKISKVVDGLLEQIEKTFECRFKKRSKRAKKLVTEKVA